MPDALPLQDEPRCKLTRPASGHLRLQHLRINPTPGEDLTSIDSDRFGTSADENRAKLVLRMILIELRLILKLEQKVHRTMQAEFLP